MATLAALDIDRIADLETAIGTLGAIETGAHADVFEYIVGLAIVTHSHD